MKKQFLLMLLLAQLLVLFGCAHDNFRTRNDYELPAKVKKTNDELICSLVDKIVDSMPKQRNLCIAVVGFSTTNGDDRQLSLYLSDRLTSEFFKKGIKVVDRINLRKAENEIMLSLNGTISEETAQDIGEVNGANVIIVGSIFDRGETATIVCRAISTEKNIVLGVSETSIEMMHAPIGFGDHQRKW